MHLEQDLLASLGPEWAYFRDPAIGGRGVAGITFVNRLKDPDQGPVVIQTSTNFVDWSSIFTNPSSFGPFQFIDTNASNNALGFYRAFSPSGH